MGERKNEPDELLTRRDALTALLGAGGAAVAFGCSSSESGSQPSDSGAEAEAGTGSAEAGTGADDASAPDTAPPEAGEGGVCEVTPEGEIGPYFADDSAAGFDRSTILSNLDGSSPQAGVPLTLGVTVLDTQKGCAPYVGAQVDIWHCNAVGVYSDIASESTASEQWLRGYQLADASGRLTFKTIIPGWYAGRTTHIHLRVRSSYSDASSTTDETNTTQCFFDQSFIDTLYTSVAPYLSEGKNPTTNAGDRVYSQEEGGANVLSLTGDNTNGYTASITIFLPLTETYDASTIGAGGVPGDGGPGGGGPPPGGGGPMGPPPDGGFGGGPMGPPPDGGFGGGPMGGGPPGGDGGTPAPPPRAPEGGSGEAQSGSDGG
jgi:protocatechuate 3,4-dioxygenase beta subunit